MTQTFKESLYFFKKNILQLMAYALLIAGIVMVLVQLLMPVFFSMEDLENLTPELIEPFAQVLNLLVKPIFTAGLIALIFSLANNDKKSIYQSLYLGVIKWPYMLFANVMTSFLVFLGMMLFILPGIWLFSRLFLVPFLLVLQNQSPLSAIINSYRLTNDYVLTLLMDLSMLIVFMVSILLFIHLLHLLSPIIIILFVLLFQVIVHVIFYRHYEILIKKDTENDL